MFCTPNSIFSGDKTEEIGGTCNTYRGEERCIQGVVEET
jgi:hypothetical protein